MSFPSRRAADGGDRPQGPTNWAIARHNRPRQATNPTNNPRFSARFYTQFHERSAIWVNAVEEASNRIADRDVAHQHIEWDPHRDWTVTANMCQGIYLRDPIIGQLTFTDIDVYNHIVYNLCRYPHTAFAFKTMRDLYFFLIHAQRREAYRYIQNIEIENFTDGTYVFQAIQQLNKCQMLTRLHLHHCRRCNEIRCRPNVWRALKRLRTAQLFQTGVAFRPALLKFTRRRELQREYCAKCTAMGATPHNILGEPNPNSAREQHLFATRMDTLRNSILR